jgi:hypothetical protein
MQLVNAYVEYFRHQAANHPDLLHTPDAGDKVFEVIPIEDAFGDLRGAQSEKSYLMRLILPTYELGDNYTANGLKRANGAFIIAKYHSSRTQDNAHYIAAAADAERVGFDIIEKMVKDSIAGHPLFYYSINTLNDLNLEVQPKNNEGDTGYVGWIFMFQFKNFFRNCPPTGLWLDGGATPFGS